MQNQLLFYLLLFISFLIFSIYLYAVFFGNKKENFEFFDVIQVDNNAYWVYNNNLYFGNLKEDRLEKNSIKKIDSFGMSAKDMQDILIGAKNDYSS